MASVTVYETLHTVQALIKDEDERKLHDERICVLRVDPIMYMCLSELERDLSRVFRIHLFKL